MKTFLSFKKVSYFKGRSLFVIIPIAIMITLFVFVASESQSILLVAKNSIFSSLKTQNEVVELASNDQTSLRGLFASSSTGYQSSDVDNIKTVANVENALLLKELPIDNITSTSLLDKKISINSLAGLESEFAKLYTNQDFTYTEGQPIPIIINANDFYEVVEDWQGKSEITVTTTNQNPGNITQTLTTSSPVKTVSLPYDISSLVGKEIEISFGGLADIATIKQETTDTGYKYSPKTEAEITAEVTARQTAISKYWDYTKISTPLKYTFKVVGLIEGADKTKSYIPNTFASKLLTDYYGNQLAARNTTSMASADYNTTYRGQVYDGTTIQEDTSSSLMGQIKNQFNQQIAQQFDSINSQIAKQNQQIASANQKNNTAVREFNTRTGDHAGPPPSLSLNTISSVQTLNASNIKISLNSGSAYYSIPGLVYNKSATTNELTGILTDTTKLTAEYIPSNLLLVKINNIDNREQVVTDINAKGYRYTDSGQYKSITRLESYLDTFIKVASITIVIITAFFIFINMSKFVSEAKKEIGILRSMGAKKLDIMGIFNIQALIYSVIAIVLGIALGVGLIFALSAKVFMLAGEVIQSILGSSIPISANVTQLNFQTIAWEQIGIYTVILIIVTLVAAFFPAWQASRISPVEAIRNG